MKSLELNKHRVECCSNNGVTHSSQPCFSLCLSSLLHSLSKLCSPFFFLGVTFYLGNYDSFIHSVLSLLNLFVIKELSFCMWMFCFMKWAMLLWFLLFILLCYNVKLGKHLVVYTWIWFGIWCLLLIKAKFFFFSFFFFCLWISWCWMGSQVQRRRRRNCQFFPFIVSLIWCFYFSIDFNIYFILNY